MPARETAARLLPVRVRHLLFTALLTSAAVGCSKPAAPEQSPSPQEPAAPEATQQASDAPTDAASAAPTALVIDASRSSINFVGENVMSKHEGGFKTFSGKVSFADGKPSSLDLEIDMTSAFADNDKLLKHLLHEDFFFVSEHPKAVFKSETIRASEGTAHSHLVSGALTLRGTTLPLEVPISVSQDGDVWRGQGTFELERKKYGIAYPGAPDNLIKDSVPVSLNFVLTQPS